MKQLLILSLLLNCWIVNAQSVQLDTLVDVGGYKIHFNIIKGSGIPILFESGAGDDGSIWNNILKPIHEVTGTTLITYDRAGSGESDINPKIKTEVGHSILNGIEELESALKKLGYLDEIILVSHSYGGFYATLFAARNPDIVKYNIRIDSNLVGWYTDDILKKIESENVPPKTNETLGIYYLVINYTNTVRYMRNIEFPENVPVIDIWSPNQRHQTNDEWDLQMKTHKEFVSSTSNREGIVAIESGHYIFKDNPSLIINSIVKAYINSLDSDRLKLDLLSKALDQNIELLSKQKIVKKN